MQYWSVKLTTADWLIATRHTPLSQKAKVILYAIICTTLLGTLANNAVQEDVARCHP